MVVSGEAKVKTAYCKVCKKRTRWQFMGIQKDAFLKPLVAYYNCEKCHDTKGFPVEDEDEGMERERKGI